MFRQTEKLAEATEKPKHPDGFETPMHEVRQKHHSKKAAIILLIRLAPGAEDKTDDEIRAEIQSVLGEGLADVPWLVLENVTVVTE